MTEEILFLSIVFLALYKTARKKTGSQSPTNGEIPFIKTGITYVANYSF